MTSEQVLQRLSEIDPGEFRKLQALADEVGADARQLPRLLVRRWRGGADAEGRKTETVLTALRELAVGVWLDSDAGGGSGARVRAMSQAGRGYLEAVKRLRVKLDRMMQGKRPMPRPPAAECTEEPDPPSRECDEGYLLARALLKTGESDLVAMLGRKQFLLMSEPRRDAEIANFQKTGQWSPLIDHDPEQGEIGP